MAISFEITTNQHLSIELNGCILLCVVTAYLQQFHLSIIEIDKVYPTGYHTNFISRSLFAF